MHMKNKILVATTSIVVGAAILTIPFLNHNSNKSNLNIAKTEESVDSEDMERREIQGAMEYYHNIRKNPYTNKVDYRDYYMAQSEVFRGASNAYKTSVLSLQWTEMGPDNVGGRTRAILIDKNNPNRLYAGAIAGGLWISNNAGSTWNKYMDKNENLAVSCIAQAPNGDIYVGSGENFKGFAEEDQGTTEMPGGGISKSTDGGVTFTKLLSTVPTSSTTFSTVGDWIGVNRVATDPVNSNRIYAATNRGLRMSNDGGKTWINPILTVSRQPLTSSCSDIDIASDGTVLVAMNGIGYISPNGESGTFTRIPANNLPVAGTRVEFGIAPSDPNYMYASLADGSANLQGVYQSTDKGQTWVLIGPGGGTGFAPLSNLGVGGAKFYGQGNYDNTLAVFPDDKTHIILGGVGLWAWKQDFPTYSNLTPTAGAGSWSLMAEHQASDLSPVYVHADKHTIVFHPTNPDIFYIGHDGGVSRTTNARAAVPFFTTLNNGFNVTQFHSVAFEAVGSNGSGVLGGTQDNGSLYIDGKGNTVKSAKEVSGGDGGESEISFINPNVFFTTTPWGGLTRTNNKGKTKSTFYPKKLADLDSKQDFASFVTPIALYESTNATKSHDSIMFIAGALTNELGLGNGVNVNFKGTVMPAQKYASIVPGSVVIKNGGSIIASDDGANNLTGSVAGSLNTFDYITGAYNFDLASAPSKGNPITITYNVQYNAGSIIELKSETNGVMFSFTTPSLIHSMDTVMVQDIIQSRFVIGCSGSNGIWMNKRPLDFTSDLGKDVWFKIMASVSGDISAMRFSPDGDVMFVTTTTGLIYRLSNLSSAIDSVTGDVGGTNLDSTALTNRINRNCVVKTNIIGNFSPKTLTDIAIDPSNPNRIVVAAGNFGVNGHIYYCDSALTMGASSTTDNFSLRQGIGSNKLAEMPVYSVIFARDKNGGTNTVVVGTEFGVYATSNITADNSSIVWTDENGELPKMLIFGLRQQTLPGSQANNSGTIYAATHGRGIWKCENFFVKGTVGIKKEDMANSTKSGISIYPNPLYGDGTISFELSRANSNIVISTFDLQGRVVKSSRMPLLQAGTQKINYDNSDLAPGTYFISVDGEGIHVSAKFVSLK